MVVIRLYLKNCNLIWTPEILSSIVYLESNDHQSYRGFAFNRVPSSMMDEFTEISQSPSQRAP